MDQNQFINTYIDIIVSTLLEHVKTNLQLQTQVKVGELVAGSKDQIIASLTQQLENNKIADDWKAKYEAAETNYSAALNKLSHMDALLKQVSEMKNIIIAKDVEIQELKEKKSNPVSKKVINKTDKKKEEDQTLVPVVTQLKETRTLDDF